MPPGGFEPTISAGEGPQAYALDRVATGTGRLPSTNRKNSLGSHAFKLELPEIYLSCCLKEFVIYIRVSHLLLSIYLL